MEETSIFTGLAEWWETQNWDAQLLYAIGGVALIIVCIQAVMSLVFGGDMDTDTDVDIGGAAHDVGLGLLSIRTVTAFFMGFGLGGAMILKSGSSLPFSLAGGFVIGIICMAIIFYIMKFLYSLRSSGTLKMGSAIGTTGTVYVALPPNGQAGGQVEIMIQGRLMTVPAISNLNEKLSPGTPIRVAEIIGGNTFRVEKI